MEQLTHNRLHKNIDAFISSAIVKAEVNAQQNDLTWRQILSSVRESLNSPIELLRSAGVAEADQALLVISKALPVAMSFGSHRFETDEERLELIGSLLESVGVQPTLKLQQAILRSQLSRPEEGDQNV
jgi:hypothetical protein